MRPARLLVAALSCVVLTACSAARDPELPLAARADTGLAPPAPPSGGDDAAARLVRAPAATAASGSARTSVVATVTGLPGRSDPVTFRGDGVIDFAAGRSRSVLAMVSGADDASGEDAELESVVAGGLLYVRLPALTSLASSSAPWLRLGPAAAGPAIGSGQSAPSFGPLTDLAGSDVGAPIALLTGVDPSSVQEVGAEVTGGTSTTTLRATVDPVAAAAGTSTEARAALEAFLAGLGARRLQVEVQLDQDDRLRRLVYEHAAAGPSGPVHQRFDTEYFDFGAAVEISVPPDDRIRDLPRTTQGPR